MKIVRILSLAAAAAGLISLGACKSNEPTYMPPQEPVGGSYIDDGK